ncbi:PREDICTED: TRAF3-interacting JNK-activating modulator isoform X1 [Pseudopodoces humilis]|uniref:TRAF3-interacting JNK-activating modulator isoform X1 n=1 Tax=Pseudopodoces humilis TaxID=181119 RepID=UPI0006B84ED9|nr:PREDICTED: TRAF3-interacting JNK-activating modulator isoform X1 [Pseudopodoces humilis]
MPRRARPQRRRCPGESSEERSERRQEERERLRCRNNTSTCRQLARPAPQPELSPRQREFLRRRNLVGQAQETLQGQEPQARTPPDPSSRLEPRPGILLQGPRSCSTFPPAQSLLSLSIPQGPGDSLSTQGTQSLPKPSSGVRDSSQQTDWGIAVLNKEMVQLSNYLTEALHRELLLKQKMVILQQLLSTLLQASEKSWQGQLNEDKLRCKLRVLENQLQACSQSYSKECVKKILIEMEDQKQTYEQKAKEALQKMLEDKLQTEQQLQNSQRSLAETREDLALWKEQDATLRAELAKVTTAHTELKNSFQALQSELQRADAQSERLRRELRELRSERSELLHTASALRSDSHTRATLLQHLQDKLQKEQEQKVTLEATVSHLQNLIHNQNNQGKSQEVTVQRKGQVFITQTPPLTPAKEKQNALLEHPEEEEEGTESLKDEMKKKASQLTAKENEEHQDTQAEEPGRAPLRVKLCSRCSSPASRGVHRAEGTPPAPSPGLCSRRSELRSELEALSEQYRSCLTQLRQCREQLNRGSRAQSGPWIPLLVAVAAVAIATFLASYRL